MQYQRKALSQPYRRSFVGSLTELSSLWDIRRPACLPRRPLMRVGSKVLRWNLVGKTLEIRRGERERREGGWGAVLQSPIPSVRSCAWCGPSFLPKCRGGSERGGPELSGRDNRPEIWFSPLSLLSVPVTEDNDPKSAAMPPCRRRRRRRLVVNSKDFRAHFSSLLSSPNCEHVLPGVHHTIPVSRRYYISEMGCSACTFGVSILLDHPVER